MGFDSVPMFPVFPVNNEDVDISSALEQIEKHLKAGFRGPFALNYDLRMEEKDTELFYLLYKKAAEKILQEIRAKKMTCEVFIYPVDEPYGEK
ncbi:MAG TPA: hypothetical protein DC049_19455, partial [Spirochaetia bacterium]|nr:hypothetical protein [Spirochaetia bacterium]